MPSIVSIPATIMPRDASRRLGHLFIYARPLHADITAIFLCGRCRAPGLLRATLCVRGWAGAWVPCPCLLVLQHRRRRKRQAGSAARGTALGTRGLWFGAVLGTRVRSVCFQGMSRGGP